MCSLTDKSEEEDRSMLRGPEEGYLLKVKGLTYKFMGLNTRQIL